MSLIGQVHVARRFQRSIRIDTDFNDPSALEGFICPESSSNVLKTMATHIVESGQGAFTWTGPYGSGKSSLVIALSAFAGAPQKARKISSAAIGTETSELLQKAFPATKAGWAVLPVVARRAAPEKVIGESIQAAGFGIDEPRNGWDEPAILDAIDEILSSRDAASGLIIFVDEMGKFLEAAARAGEDLYLFQQLAEKASRSNGRFVIVGILHQAFEEYSNRLSRDSRDEWAKIQGRFVDLAVNAAGEEQIDLLARAIESDHSFANPGRVATAVSTSIRDRRSSASENLPNLLEGCWPLHPIVAALLGPISRRRFGQNQRSIFGFLNSAEPNGFQEYLHNGSSDQLYGPERLWGYLKVNLEPSILASPDGHRWAMASEAIDRCEAIDATELQLSLLKTIGLIDLFRERSGLYASESLLRDIYDLGDDGESVEAALGDLAGRSFIVYRRHLDAFSLYAGSDFNIEEAIEAALDEVPSVDFSKLQKLAGLQPILAKRHFHETGTLRWFDVQMCSMMEAMDVSSAFQPSESTMGKFVIAFPTEGEEKDVALELCQEIVASFDNKDLMVGLPQDGWAIVAKAKELLALEHVRVSRPELHGDAVARKEVDTRLVALQNQLEDEIREAFYGAFWAMPGETNAISLSQSGINNLASKFAGKRFEDAPSIKNELLNRTKPSSNAVAAQNALMRRMVLNEGEPRLGIIGYPAEGGLFESLLEASNLYTKTKIGYEFTTPTWKNDPAYLHLAWGSALAHLKKEQERLVSIDEIFDIWELPPFGIKRGLMSVLGVAFLLSNRQSLAFYREGLFQSHFNDLDVDYLAKDPKSIQVRWMDLSQVSKTLLSGMADVVRSFDDGNALRGLEPIDVARGLISIFAKLPAWTKRTTKLSANAIQVRDLFKHSSDPNRLLFDDLPALFGVGYDLQDADNTEKLIRRVHEALEELVGTYPKMLLRLNENMLAELHVPNTSPQSLAELSARAKNIHQMAGDFRLDALISRLVTFDGGTTDIESVLSLAANKPPKSWVDADLDRASIELADLAQKFVRTETFARVKGRADKRHALAIMVNRDGRPTPMSWEFDVSDSEQDEARVLANSMVQKLKKGTKVDNRVVLAALAELTRQYIEELEENKSKPEFEVEHETDR